MTELSSDDVAVDPACAEGGDCTEALRELQRYLDGELPEAELGDIRSHISRCYPCADRATFEEQVRALVRERCAERAPEGLMDRIRGHLHAMTEGQA